MSERQRHIDDTDVRDELRAIVDPIALAATNRLIADPKLLQGHRDPRLIVTGLTRVGGGDDMPGERLALTLNDYLVVTTMKANWAYTWAHEEAYAPLDAAIRREFPEMDEHLRREVMFGFVPHLIRIATVVIHYGAHENLVLLRLKNPGRAENPASVAGVLHGVVHEADRTFRELSEEQARSPFSPFFQPAWSVECDCAWSLLFPEAPEILLVRYAEFDGDPEQFVATWTEEKQYPYVWVPQLSVARAVEGDNADLVRDVRAQDFRYRALARDLEKKIVVDRSCETCGSTLESHCESVPVASSLSVTDDLALDATTQLIVSSLFA